MTAHTRRTLLGSMVAGTAALVTGGHWAVPASATTPQGGLASVGGADALTLDGIGLARADRDPATTPGAHILPAALAGDRCLVIGTLAKATESQGTFHADVVRLHHRGQSPHGGSAATLEQHLFTLADGTMAGSGTSDAHGRGTFAVVGGTGAYAGRRGSYTADQRRGDLGGDGTAHFEFTFIG